MRKRSDRVLTADEMVNAVENMKGMEGVFIRELRVESGFGYISEKRVDLFLMDMRTSKRNVRTAFEIKRSRNDFARELRKPLKRWAGMLFSNKFYFVAPEGMVKPSEVPEECGLIEVDAAGVAAVRVKAPWRDGARSTWPFVASLLRSALKLQEEGE